MVATAECVCEAGKMKAALLVTRKQLFAILRNSRDATATTLFAITMEKRKGWTYWGIDEEAE